MAEAKSEREMGESEGHEGREGEGRDGHGWHGRRRPRGLKILMFVAIGAVAVALFGLLVMGLWNALVPALFAGPQVSWLQGLGLFALSRILLGGWGGGRHRRDGGHWRGRWERKMEGLSPEERERMKAMMRGRGPGMRGARDAATT